MNTCFGSSWVRPFCFAVGWLFIQSTCCYGQPDEDVAHWLERETAALLDIQDVATTYSRVRELPLFNHPKIQRAMELASDERFPLVDADGRNQLVEQLLDAESLIDQMERVTLVVHDFGDDGVVWSLFILANEAGPQEMSDQVKRLTETVRGTVRLVSDEAEEKAEQKQAGGTPEETVEDGDAALPVGRIRRLGWCRMRQVGRWLVLSNHASLLDDLPSRQASADFRSLANMRKYKAVRMRESKLEENAGNVFVYCNPVKMRGVIPYSSPEGWELAKVQELPACGISISFPQPESDDELPAMILGDAIIKFTDPPIGFAKMFQEYAPVEIPPLARKPIEVHAFSRNEAAFWEEAARAFDKKNGKGKAAAAWEKYFKPSGLSFEDDVVLRRSGFAATRFFNKDRSQREVITLEKIKDRAAAKAYSEGVFRVADANGQSLEPTMLAGVEGWQVPTKGAAENSGVKGMARSRETRVDLINPYHDGYAMTDQWWVQGDLPALKDQLKLLTGGEGVDHGEPIRKLVNDLCRRTRVEQPPVLIKYYTKDSWAENFDNIELQYAVDNAVPTEMEIDMNLLQAGRTLDFEDLEKVARGKGEVDGVKKFNVENPTPAFALQRMTMNLPLELGPRNDDGFRLNLTRREDLTTAVKLVLLRCVAESFPKLLIVYSQGDNHVRIAVGIYK